MKRQEIICHKDNGEVVIVPRWKKIGEHFYNNCEFVLFLLQKAD